MKQNPFCRYCIEYTQVIEQGLTALKGYVAVAQKQPKREGVSDECDREHLPTLPFSSWDCFYNGDSNDVHNHPEKVFFSFFDANYRH